MLEGCGKVYLWAWDSVSEGWVKVLVTASGFLKVLGVSDTVVVKRMTGVGQVVAGAAKLHWQVCNPSAGLSLWELTDAIASGGAVILDCFSTTREAKMGTFLPPCPFATGIYLETFTNMSSITLGYSV